MRRLWRAPFVVVALASMAWGLLLGLVRIGWAMPLPWPDQLILHGPLMIGGFLGTLIGLERAVGVARPWAYAAPSLTAAGSLVLVFGPSGKTGPILITMGSTVIVSVFATIVRREPTLFATTMMLGAVAWLVGNSMWVAGEAIYRFVFWWVLFLVLSIAGERLELGRVRRPSTRRRALFLIVVVLLITGVLMMPAAPEFGPRTVGAGLVGSSVWFASFDVARRTVLQRGVTRFVAACLLSGYLWLGVGGALLTITAVSSPGLVYDAILHAIFVGFVLAMVFGHAPIVFPAILGRPLTFHPAFYVHLIVLHASLAARIVGDLVEAFARWRSWGGLLNGAAVVVFLANTLAAIVRRPKQTRT